MTENADIAGLIVSRICHDLISPVGAIVNGTDLIAEIGTGDVQSELAMISQSAVRASATLQFYRIAFGTADRNAELTRSAIEAQATEALTTRKICLEWQGIAGPPVTRPEIRLVLQVLMCARAIVGMQGRITVRLDPHESFPISIDAVALASVAGTASLNREALDMLVNEPQAGDIGARLVEFALVHRTARQLRVELSVTANAERATIRAARP